MRKEWGDELTLQDFKQGVKWIKQRLPKQDTLDEEDETKSRCPSSSTTYCLVLGPYGAEPDDEDGDRDVLVKVRAYARKCGTYEQHRMRLSEALYFVYNVKQQKTKQGKLYLAQAKVSIVETTTTYTTIDINTTTTTYATY